MTDPTKIIISAEDRTGQAIGSAVSNLNRLTGAGEFAGKALGAIFGAATVGGLVHMVQSTAAAADELSKLSQRTGVTVEALSGLRYAAELNGATFADLDQGLKGLSNKMLDAAKGSGEAASLFKSLGIDVTDAAGRMRPLEAVLGDVADAFQQSADGPAKLAIASKLGEESFQKLIPTLDQGSAGLRAMHDEAVALGAVFDTDGAAAAVAFNDNITRLETQARGLAITFGNQLLPTLSAITDEILGVSTSLGGVSPAAEAADSALKGLYNTATGVVTAFQLAGKGIGGVVAALVAVGQGKFSLAGSIIDELIADLDKTAQAAAASMRRVAESGTEVAVAAEKTTPPVDRLATALTRLSANGPAAKDAAKALAEEYKRFSTAIKAAAEEAANAADADAKIIEIAREGLEDLKRQVDEQRNHNEELGLTVEALADLRAARLEDVAAQNEQMAAQARARVADDAEIAAYEEKARLFRELASLQREGAVKEATIEAAEAARDAWRDISDDVAASLTDAILQGGDAWKSLVKSIEATVIRATILPIVQGGVQAVLQAVGIGPGGGSGGLFSQAGNAASLYSTGSSLMGYGQAAYTGYTAAAGGTDLSAAIAAYNSSGYYGTAASLQAGQAAGGVAGSGAGAAVPYLGAMAAFLVAAEWFAGLGNGLRRFGSAVETTLGDTGDIVSRLIDNTNDTVDIIDSRFARAFESDAQAEARLTAYNEDRAQREGGAGYEGTQGRGARLEDVDPLLAEINAAAIESTQAFISSLTGRDSPLFSLSSLFMSRAGDDSTGRLYVRGSGGQDLLSFNQDFKAGQSGFEEFGQSFSRVTLAVLRSMDDLDTGLAAIVDAVDPATAALEDVQAAISLLGQFQSALDAAEAFGNVDDALEAVRIGTLDATSQFGLMRDELTRAAAAGELSVEQILAGMGTVYQGFTQLLQNIDAASRSVADSTANNIRSIQLAVLDDAGKYGFLDSEIARQLDTLRSLTDPALITDYLGRVQGNLSAAFGLLQDGEQQRLADEFIARFNEVGAIAQQQLDVARDQAIADQRAQRDEMVAAIREAFADPAAALAAAAQTISGTTIGVDARVTVNVPAEAEVSTFVLGDN